MSEFSLTWKQAKTIGMMAAGHEKGRVTLLSPPEGEVFDKQYVEVRILDDESGAVLDSEILTWAGTRPNLDGRYLEGSD